MLLRLCIGTLMLTGIYTLVGLGYSLIYKASGLMNFAQGDLFMFGAFIGYTFYSMLKLPFALALVISLAVMFLLGYVLQRTLIRKLIANNATMNYIVLATIGLQILLRNTVMLIWGSRVFHFPSIFGSLSLSVGDVQIAPESVFTIVVSIVAMIALHLFMSRSKFGTAMRAAAQDPLAASECGIDVNMTTGITWGLSTMLAALAGILFGPINGIILSMGVQIGQRGFSSAVIGGYGNMYGVILGALILAATETFTAGLISTDYKDFVAFLMLMIFLFIKPTGLLNERALND